ncbi:MAG: type IV secretion system DotC family protein [Legionellaceae bacterium]|nr:type IV secretion system DotC family protein [Legionellaceae bacterium]
MLILIRKASIIGMILLVSCTSTKNQPQTTGDTATLAGLQMLGNQTKPNLRDPQNSGKIRVTALKEMALTVGAQSGLASRAKLIDDELVKQTKNLDAIYDFNALILENNVLPPVLLEGRKTFNMADTQTIRISDRTYKVAKQAHFVTTPPGWRQYLWMDYSKPEMPHVSLLPNTKEEREIWYAYVTQGWQNGIDQANTILEESIARIKEDFTGMILYRKLLAMNMVSPPYVSHTDLGVTGDEKEIHIDDKVLRITALPALNMNSNQWRAALEKDEDKIEQFEVMEKSIQSAQIKITNKSWQPVIDPTT